MRSRSRTSQPKRPPALQHTLSTACHALLAFAVVGSVSLTSLASAGVPSDAFGYSSDEVEIASVRLERAEADLRRQRLGLSAGIDIDPGFSYGGAFDDPKVDPEFNYDLSVGIDVDYTFDLDNILGAEIAVLRARQNLRDQRRSDVTDTLVIHADLLRAQLDLAEVEGEFARARSALEEAEAGHLEGAVTDSELERARIAFESAALDLEITTREISELREQAGNRGIGGDAVYAPLQFVLPEVEAEATFDYQLRLLDLKRQQARARERGLFGVIENVTLFGGYEGTDAAISGRVSLRRGNPGAAVGLDYRDDDEDDWNIGISATIHFDDRTPADFADSELEIREAEEALRTYLERFPDNALQARLAVEERLVRLELSSRLFESNRVGEAELETAIAELELELASIEERVGVLGQRRDNATREEQDALNQQIRDLNGQLGDVERALRDATRNLERSVSRRTAEQDAVFRAWRDYVRSVDGYLRLVDGSWEDAL